MLDRLNDPGFHPVFFVYVERLGPAFSGHYFTTHRLPGVGLSEQTICLDPESIIQEDGQEDRKFGVAAPRTMRLILGPSQSEELTYLLAPEQDGQPGAYVEGRLAYVFMAVADASGSLLDAVASDPLFIADNQCMIFAGPVESCAVRRDMMSWSLVIQGLEALLDTTIGGEKIEAYLAPCIQGTLPPKWAPKFYLSAGQSTIHWRLWHYHTGASSYHMDLSADLGTTDSVDLGAAYNRIIEVTNAAIAATVFSSASLRTDTQPEGWPQEPGELLEDDKLRLNFRFVLIHGTGPGALIPIEQPAIEIMPQEQGSAWPYWGFIKNQRVKLWQSATEGTDDIIADQAPAMLYISAEALSFVVFDATATPPAAGHFLLKYQDGTPEIIRYHTAVPLGGDMYRLEADKRGALGTTPRQILTPIGVVQEGPVYLLAAIADFVILFCAALEDVPIQNMVRSMASGGDFFSAFYDPALEPGAPGWIWDGFFDEATFSTSAASIPASVGRRDFAWAEPINLRDFFAREMAALGFTIQARWDRQTRRYTLHLDRLGLASTYTLFAPVVSGDLLHDEGIEIRQSRAGCVNVARISACQSELLGESKLDVEAIWADSVTRLGVSLEERYEIQGIKALAISQEAGELHAFFLQGLAHTAYPYQLIYLPLRRYWWRLQPGDMISVTIPGLPGFTGGRGWTNEPLRVLGVRRAFLPGQGEPVCIATCLRGTVGRLSLYSPSARVAGWDLANRRITLDDNFFSDATRLFPLDETGFNKDVKYFEHAAKIRLTDLGDDDGQWEYDVFDVNVAAGTIDLVAPVGRAPAVGDIITASQWLDRSAPDKVFGALADPATDLLGGIDPAFRFA